MTSSKNVMMNRVEANLQTKELQKKYYTWDIIGRPSFEMLRNMSGVVTSDKEWGDISNKKIFHSSHRFR
jgi:hypothetical protein